MSTTLNAGDISITGFNFDNPDELSFVLLTDIVADTEIKFTDNGIRNDGSFLTGEGIYTWTAQQGYSVGSVVTLSDLGNIAFYSCGDQIVVYQGSESNPAFLFALNSQGNGFQTNATSESNSALPPELVEGETAIALSEIDNASYVGQTTGTKTELLAAISNQANWTGSNTNRQTLASDPFTVSAEGGGSGGGTGSSSDSGNGGTSNSVHLTFGNPSGAITDPSISENYLLVRDQYAMSYNDTTKIANWVGWQINDSWLGDTPRQNDFRADSDLPADFFQVDASDYSGSGFDRGHITPSADRTASVTDNSNTFYMTNMIPQAPSNNRGVWASFENHLRTLLTSKDLYIYAGGRGTGGDGSNGFATTIEPGITVPSHTWKTVLVVDGGETPDQVSEDDYTITLDIPNSQSVAETSWQDWVIDVDTLACIIHEPKNQIKKNRNWHSDFAFVQMSE